jgi:hypothetical protein
MTIDFTTLIAGTSMEHSATNDAGEFEFFLSDAKAVLAAKVPDLCPDCHDDPGFDGMVWSGAVDYSGERYYIDCDHPDAPSIGKLLAIGAAVMTATVNEADYVFLDEPIMKSKASAYGLLEVLRAVEQ